MSASDNAKAGQEAAEEVFSEVREALDKAELSLDYLITKLKEELEATYQRVFFDRGDKNHEAKVVYSDELIDWQTRQKARMDAHRLRGDYPAEKHDIGGSAFTSLDKYVEALEKASAITDRIAGEKQTSTDE